MVTTSRLTALLALAIALAGIAPLFQWLETFPRLMVVTGFLTGILQELRGRWRLKNWQFNAALVPVFIWYALQYSRNNPVQPVVSVLAIMLAARLCGEKSIRNLLQINLLALFCLASRSLFDLSPAFLFWLGILLLLIPVSLILLTFHAQDNNMVLMGKEVKRVILAALLITAVTVPALAFFFPILPRTPFPLWNFLSPAINNSTGIADQVEPGSVQNAAESRTLAFRAEMPHQHQPPYWRGIVFNRITGNRWNRNPAIPAETIRYQGERISQTIYPEPSPSHILISLDAPSDISLPRAQLTGDATIEYPRGLTRRISYTVKSTTGGILRTTTNINRSFYLTIPTGLSPQLLQLAEKIKKDGRTDEQRIALTEQYFMNGGYRYSRQDLPTGKDAINQFMFVSKQGHCEFFASSFALLLRAAGVPARLVGGYLGGEYNEMGGYYLVSEDTAHVWVEAYVSGKGWIRTDPSRFAVNAGALWNGRSKMNLATRLRLVLDALDYRWNRTVVSYDFQRQTDQLRTAGSKLRDLQLKMSTGWKKPIVLLLPALLVLFVILRLSWPWLWRSREERLIRRFKTILKKRFKDSIELENKGLFELAAATGDKRVHQFASLYAAAVYRDKGLGKDEVRQLKKLLDELDGSRG